MGRYLSILQIRFRSDMQAGTIDLLMTRVPRKHLPSAIRYTLKTNKSRNSTSHLNLIFFPKNPFLDILSNHKTDLNESKKRLYLEGFNLRTEMQSQFKAIAAELLEVQSVMTKLGSSCSDIVLRGLFDTRTSIRDLILIRTGSILA